MADLDVTDVFPRRAKKIKRGALAKRSSSQLVEEDLDGFVMPPRVWWALGGLGVVAVGLLFLGRKKIASAVVATVAQGVAVAANNILDVVALAPIGMPIPPYALLPPGPPEVGPLKEDRTLDGLSTKFRPKAEGVKAQLDAIFKPLGISVFIAETRRTSIRQLFLWGIGRFYKAPGRTGIVTKVRDAGAKHKDGDAIDLGFTKGGVYLSGSAFDSGVLPVLKANAAQIEAKWSVKWGGNFPGSFKDWPHFENV